jgi:alkylated DNA repair dioxygenase AlkB
MQSSLLTLFVVALLLLQTCSSLSTTPFSTPQTRTLKAALQKCYTPKDVLDLIGTDDLLTTDNDPFGDVSSLCLVRLSKQLVALDNQCRHDPNSEVAWKSELTSDSSFIDAWRKVSRTLGESISLTSSKSGKHAATTVESHVEGIKSMSVLSRILPELNAHWDPCLESLEKAAGRIAPKLLPHQLSGLKFSYDCLRQQKGDCALILPRPLQESYDDLKLPFRIYPDSMSGIFANSALDTLVSQVQFQVDEIRTVSNRVVTERRKTAWQGDDGVAPFAYSGKSMETNRWSPLVQSVRDRLVEETGIYYDGCLLNLYPDGGSGMRYHIDPDQGVLWNYETVVVSVGATRRFSFREIPGVNRSSKQQQPHTFVLMEGDVTEMFGDCQTRYQHTVKTADDKKEEASRASLVFKRTLSSSK